MTRAMGRRVLECRGGSGSPGRDWPPEDCLEDDRNFLGGC